MSGKTCAYCAAAVADAAPVCTACGAPATHPRAETSATPPPKPERKDLAKPAAAIQWYNAALALVAAALFVTAAVALPRLLHSDTRPTTTAGALPGPLRNVAACTRHAASAESYVCTIAADSPLVRDLTAGRDLTFYCQLMSTADLTAVIARWRAQGSETVSDGTIFNAISLSAAVRHANTATGLRIDTAALPSTRAARTFLMRAGLTRRAM